MLTFNQGDSGVVTNIFFYMYQIIYICASIEFYFFFKISVLDYLTNYNITEYDRKRVLPFAKKGRLIVFRD